MFRNKTLLLLLLFVFTTKNTFSQCAMCKAVVENGDGAMAEGVNSGITYLMVFPYLLIGILFFTIYRYNKKVNN
jgi:predicted dithiol-disulfide oxidoreductase (DUF899 family)